MQQLDEKDYRPAFITETDELRWDDCTVCSTLMATATATLGETVSSRDWRPLGRAQLKSLREKIRNHLPADKQAGATSMADMRYAFGKEYPWLPEIPFYDEQNSKWGDFIDSLLRFKKVYVVMGNPALVDNANSRLRRWTNSDDFGHAIYADHAIKSGGIVKVFIMDPLGRGEYDGEYVPENELKQFTWTYGAGFVKASGFPRGGWSRAARNAPLLIEKLRRVQEDLLDAEKAVANISARLAAAQSAKQAADKALEVAQNAAKTAETARAACQIALGNLETDNDTLEAEIASLKEQYGNSAATIDALTAQVDELEAQLAESQKQTEANASLLAICQATVAKQAETLKKRWATIQDLKKKLAKK